MLSNTKNYVIGYIHLAKLLIVLLRIVALWLKRFSSLLALRSRLPIIGFFFLIATPIVGYLLLRRRNQFEQKWRVDNGVDKTTFLSDKDQKSAWGLSPRPALTLVSHGQTHVGSRHEANEDNLLLCEGQVVYRGIRHPIGLYAIADGIGGYTAGEVASHLIVETLAEKVKDDILVTEDRLTVIAPNFDPIGWVREAILAANNVVYAHRRQAKNNMGSTLVLALLIGDMVHIGHVGDSRAYIINERGIQQLTTDHSLVEQLVASGQITREEAQYHPQRHIICQSIGDKVNLKPTLVSHRLSPGDRLLLCSDGLSSLVSDKNIQHIVMKVASPSEACRQLINAANILGGDDNITVIVVQMQVV